MLLASCSSETQMQMTPMSVTYPPTVTSPIAIVETESGADAKTTVTPENVITVLPESDVTPLLIGTPISGGEQPISLQNINNLKQVAQWGRGNIQGIRFTPDGKSFVVGTALGLTVYDTGDLASPPSWTAFDNPQLFETMYFSKDGKHILLISGDKNRIIKYPTGVAENNSDFDWNRPIGGIENYRDVTVRSPNNLMEFRSRFMYEYNEKLFSEEYVVREMYDDKGNLLYVMPDDIPYITYNDRVEPEGCDLGVFSPCGNALMSLAMAPEQTEFSPSGDTFAILYTVPSLFNSSEFSFLRVYDSFNGSFIMSLGGREHPISGFSYSPDSKSIGVAYLDGSVQIWDIGAKDARFGARHMNPSIGMMTYTSDGKYLLVQRSAELEIRQTKDGSMIGRFDAVTFAVSPNENLVAIGDRKGMIRIRRIDNGENVLVFQAHSDMIYSIAFSDDGRYLATGGRDCDVKMWDATTGKLLHYFEETRIDAYDIGENSRIFSYYMKFIPNTDMVMGFGSWGTAVAWDIDSGATRFIIQSAPLDFYNGMITVKPHFPEYFWVDQTTNRFYINEVGYDLASGEVVDKVKPESLPDGCWGVGPKALDGSITITRGYDENEGSLCVLDAASKELLYILPVSPNSDSYFIDWPYISPDGTQLLVTTTTGVILVYQIIP